MRRLSTAALCALLVHGACGAARASEPPPPHSEIPVDVRVGLHFVIFLDPSPNVLTKEFALFFNTVPDTVGNPGGLRDLFHLMYQRTAGAQVQEQTFAHAWSPDLYHWVVDTAAFSVDTTAWNALHVWAPSLVQHEGKVYMFYAGVDATEDQSIGYATTSLLDTTNTVWDPERVQVWRAADTKWAVPDPALYSGQTQFRDPYVIADPDSAGRLLMFYAAHDSVDFKLNRGGLAIGVARSEPGTVNAWKDLGYYPKTLRSVTSIPQLEGPHAFPVNGSNTGWRLMFSSAGTPPGETGTTTIRFEDLAPGFSVADTTPAHWGPPRVLMSYLHGDNAVYGWSGSEELHLSGADYLAGFTAWGPFFQGIAISRMTWNGSNFTLGLPSVTSVDLVHSAARGVRLSLSGYTPHADRVRFELDTPVALEAKLEIFDAMGRRVASLLARGIAPGRTNVVWDVSSGSGVASGVYFARLSFAGGVRAVMLPIAR
jgi:glycosyl hydrolase family 32